MHTREHNHRLNRRGSHGAEYFDDIDERRFARKKRHGLYRTKRSRVAENWRPSASDYFVDREDDDLRS